MFIRVLPLFLFFHSYTQIHLRFTLICILVLIYETNYYKQDDCELKINENVKNVLFPKNLLHLLKFLQGGVLYI